MGVNVATEQQALHSTSLRFLTGLALRLKSESTMSACLRLVEMMLVMVLLQ